MNQKNEVTIKNIAAIPDIAAIPNKVVIADLTDSPAQRRDRPTIALTISANPLASHRGQKRGWRLRLMKNTLPVDINPQGALVMQLPNDKLIQQFKDLGCALVRVGASTHPNDSMLPAVLPHQGAQGALAAEHFAERGFLEVAYFGNAPWVSSLTLYRGFQKKARELGMRCHLYRFKNKTVDIKEDGNIRQHREFITWIKDLPKPLGLLVPSDRMAEKFCAWMEQSGINLPEEVALVSRGNDPRICDCTMPTISSIDTNEEARISAACDLLEKLMAGQEPKSHKPVFILPRGIVVRESSSVLATTDKMVASALRYMWDNLDRNLSVDLIAKVVGTSGRTLKRRFKLALNRGVIDELRRKRLQEAKHLLASTDLTIAQIGLATGFRSINYLHRAFRASFVMTPKQYRKSLQQT